ncbi:hypothetical protein J3459_006813 [Metarhizium acridum]|nr:hypothetical protein J3459_006813 [Metarhizium acridum]
MAASDHGPSSLAPRMVLVKSMPPSSLPRAFNLVLVSRTKSKLESLAKELQEKYHGKDLKIKIHAMDFAKDDDARL